MCRDDSAAGADLCGCSITVRQDSRRACGSGR